MIPRLICALLLAAVAAACHESPSAPSSPVDSAPPQITALPRDLTAAERSLIQADNRFTFKAVASG